jgi:hypothetical protein
MAGENELATTATGLWAGSVKPFLIAHPVGVAILGGVLVGAGTYYLMNKVFSKKESQEEPAAA